jgi:hypothetical protein
MHGARAILLVCLADVAVMSRGLAPPAPVTVFGPGSIEMRLIAAKLISRAGYRTTLVVEEGKEKAWLRQMYGKDASTWRGSQVQCLYPPFILPLSTPSIGPV